MWPKSYEILSNLYQGTERTADRAQSPDQGRIQEGLGACPPPVGRNTRDITGARVLLPFFK